MPTMEKIVSCQISYTPMGVEDISERVEKILQVVKNSSLEYKVSSFATEVKGTETKIFSLIRKVYDAAIVEGHFILDIKISDICGC